MPDNSVGVYTLPPSYKVTNGDATDENQHNPPFEDLAQAMSNRLHRDGRTSWTGNQNANGNKITGLASGSSDGDALTVGQARGSSEKTNPADNDRFLIADSAASWAFKRLTWANLKAALASTFMTISGATQTITGYKKFSSSLTGINQATSSGTMLEVFSNETQAAGIAFHRSGVYAAYFGLDTDNQLKFGGWSLGANAYEVWHHGRVNASGWAVPTAPTQSGHVATKQYVDARQSVGVGQTWQDVKASRALNTSYQNTTGRSIGVMVKYDWTAQALQVSHNGSSWVTMADGDGNATVTAIIPPGHYYRLQGGDPSQVKNWSELR